jgi:hypothetical protein
MSFFVALLNNYLGTGFDEYIDNKGSLGKIVGNVFFTYSTNLIGGLIGPLPTVLPNIKPVLALYAPGLFFKVLISIPFLFGLINIFKNGLKKYYPIAFFILLEILSLFFILQSLELRKSMPHFALIYLISFGWISEFTENIRKHKSSKLITVFLHLSFLASLFLIVLWNLR